MANLETLRALEVTNRAADRAEELQKLRTADWNPGDVYAPHDLSWVEMRKRKTPRRPNQDAFDVLGINPLLEYKVGYSFETKARRRSG